MRVAIVASRFLICLRSFRASKLHRKKGCGERKIAIHLLICQYLAFSSSLFANNRAQLSKLSQFADEKVPKKVTVCGEGVRNFMPDTGYQRIFFYPEKPRPSHSAMEVFGSCSPSACKGRANTLSDTFLWKMLSSLFVVATFQGLPVTGTRKEDLSY